LLANSPSWVPKEEEANGEPLVAGGEGAMVLVWNGMEAVFAAASPAWRPEGIVLLGAVADGG
jgi:hypothetical protein